MALWSGRWVPLGAWIYIFISIVRKPRSASISAKTSRCTSSLLKSVPSMSNSTARRGLAGAEDAADMPADAVESHKNIVEGALHAHA